MSEVITIRTKNRTELIDITSEVQAAVTKHKIKKGLVHIFVPHTTAGLIINEHADPDVAEDILNTLNKLVPEKGAYRHREGNSDAHIKSALTGIGQVVGIENGHLHLGRWQGIFFCEFDGPRTRQVELTFLPMA